MGMEMILGVLASMITMWFSRVREFRADEGSAKLVGKEKMIASLKSLEKMYNITPSDKDNGKLAAFQISSRTISASQLFASHPPLEARIENLENFKY
jgi:heat shock protein HtpX